MIKGLGSYNEHRAQTMEKVQDILKHKCNTIIAHQVQQAKCNPLDVSIKRAVGRQAKEHLRGSQNCLQWTRWVSVIGSFVHKVACPSMAGDLCHLKETVIHSFVKCSITVGAILHICVSRQDIVFYSDTDGESPSEANIDYE